MSSSSTDGFSQFTFHFRRLNLDSLFSIDDRNRMLNWIDRARCLLIEILRSEHTTPKLILFRSYSHDGNVDGGDLVERLLLDGELHLSKPPPTPPILFLIVSADGTQVPLPKEVVEELTISSNEHDDSRKKSILNRFCFDIIPRIQDNIERLTLDPLSTDRVLSIGSYSKLHKLTLVNFQLEMASRIFNDGSSFNIFKHKISHLTITINDGSTDQYIWKLSTNVLMTIFTMFINLTYLHFCLKDICRYPPTSFIDLVSTTCYPSNIIHLNVRVRNFNDCLCLLDGRLCQLQTFIVEVDKINTTSMTINHSVKYFKLQ
ncbi:unnamed protein product [Rotaria sordida]|uniref:Uncharacterized protein n=1 Tax=Rotaria sordida TaxID=392033 RepID=A0A818QGS5_9BILA|nr:unnamed protein product [Rotaria sordida]